MKSDLTVHEVFTLLEKRYYNVINSGASLEKKANGYGKYSEKLISNFKDTLDDFYKLVNGSDETEIIIGGDNITINCQSVNIKGEVK